LYRLPVRKIINSRGVVVMQHNEIESPQRNINGFLKHRFDWNENVASKIAEREGLTLTEKHWDIIHFIRTEFYANNGHVPMEYQIKRGMEQEWKTPLADSDLRNLFPGVSNRQGAKIAGCLTMNTVEDLLAIKGDAVWSIGPDHAIIDAIKLLIEKNIGALMVTDGKRLIGVVSERDFTRNIILQNRSITETRVRDIMSTDVISVTPDETLEQCMAVMTDRGFRHLPVLDNDRLAGVLSMPDLVKIIVEQQRFTIDRLENGAS